MLSPEILSEMAGLLGRNERFAVATLIEVRGSTPQKAGARILVRADGTTVGTLGGGCIEAEAVESARAALRDGGSRLLEFELTEDIAVDYGLACGGNERILVAPVDARMLAPELVQALTSAGPRRTGGAIVTVVTGEVAPGSTLAMLDGGAVHGDLGALHEDALAVATRASSASAPAMEQSNGATYFVEPIAPPTEVIVVGAGHVGRAVAEAAKLLGHRIAVIDDRPEFANRERF